MVRPNYTQKAAKGKDYIMTLNRLSRSKAKFVSNCYEKSFSIAHFVLLLELVFAGLYIYLTQRLLKDKGCVTFAIKKKIVFSTLSHIGTSP